MRYFSPQYQYQTDLHLFLPRLNYSSSQYPRSPPRWTAMKPAEKHFRCTICQRGFTRIDHLKRHHLRRMYCFLHPEQLAYACADSGQKPYSCVFCNEAFARWYVREKFQQNFLNSHLSPLVIIFATTMQSAPSGEIARSPRPARGVAAAMHVFR